jgi:multidrug resistance protein
MRKPSLLVILLTVFIDLVGFGIIVPFVPVYSRHYGAEGFVIGLIIASFSAMQFLFAPVWGRLSDRHGRRPVLLISTLGAAASYALFAFGAGLSDHNLALWVMVASRMLAGICGGNITVAQAYIADITPRENRSKRMGLIGMAFGLGFIFGPIIGGVSLHHWGFTGPGWVAASLCAANFVLALFVLQESRQPTSEPVAERPHLDQWIATFRKPKIGLLIVTFFLATFCFSCFESTLPLVVSDNFKLDIQRDERSATTVVYLFAYCGIIGALVQGGMIGRLVKKYGEPKLILLSLALTGISFLPLPFITGQSELNFKALTSPGASSWWMLLGALGLLSIGSSLTRPPLFGYLSNLTHEHEQGATIGVAQSAGSLARILGPMFATTLHDWRPAVPYVACALILFAGAVAVRRKLCAPASAQE